MVSTLGILMKKALNMKNVKVVKWVKLIMSKFLVLALFGACALHSYASVNAYALASTPTLVQPKLAPLEPVKKALFIGNSFSFYNNGVHNHLGSLVRASGEWSAAKNRYRLSTLSGGHIYEHLDDLDFLLAKPEGTWEAVVLQGHSEEPVDAKKQARFVKALSQAVKKVKDKDLQAILLMTWGYKGQPDMGIELANAYTSIANELDVLVLPVGLAFAAAERELPNIDLFVPDVLGVKKDQNGKASLRYRKDVKHPSEAGTYLMACVIYASFYQKSPEGNIFTAGLEPSVALELQKLSWMVTQDFYKNNKD